MALSYLVGFLNNQRLRNRASLIAHGADAQRNPILLLLELSGVLFRLSVNTPALEVLFQFAPR